MRKVLEALQDRGPCTRASLTRISGISAPTVSKAVGSLLEFGLLEEGDSIQGAPGRPGTLIRLARDSAQVIGVILDATRCHVISAGLDGTIRQDRQIDFPTPDSYESLLDRIEASARTFMEKKGVKTLGLGISTPGLINSRTGRAMLSPNLHVTDGRSPDQDLARRLGVDCVMHQETQALCLGERMYRAPESFDDFVMLEISTGLGVGVVMDGRLIGGHSGLAGELGHVTVALDGPLCGCGNRGCLETLATDSTLTRAISKHLGRDVGMDDVKALIRAGDPVAERALQSVCEYLAIAIAAAVNLWNPATLFVHGRLFDVRDGLFETICDLARKRTLPPSLADCQILRARWTKRHGAVACAIHHLFDAHGPDRS
ncbi:ROK family protein [Paludisphaera borealis]|nr:ROK family transcriptional regulator [Paludisphaera borealis]MDR3623203.1 ROK family transcriptional regulator [Paludisphaera borealis]